MAEFLEIWSVGGVQLIPLEGEEVTVGRWRGNAIVLVGDDEASRVHAAVRRVGPGWCIRDLSSRNGTFVNGERIDRDRPLHPGDDIIVGKSRMVYRGDVADDEGLRGTTGRERPPELTKREREVLMALFKPALDATVFTEPATTREVARALNVSEAAVKQHLLRLYDKFGIHEQGERRRVRLANEALRRGAITLADVRAAGR